MAKKYLSLEEAAHFLKVEPLELQRMRERGEIRGFQDRGNWRFRLDEVEELYRSRQDSNPEVPIQWDEGMDESIFFDDSDSDVKVTDGADLGGSDSDVRLVFDETLGGPGSSGEVSIPNLGDSDSDVRLDQIPSAKKDPTKKDTGKKDTGKKDKSKLEQTWGSDSDIRLNLPAGKSGQASDSDVKLVGADEKVDSDSDVKLAENATPSTPMKVVSDSDSDVKLTDGKTDQADQLAHSDSDVKLVGGIFDTDSDSDVKLTGSLVDFALPDDEPKAGGSKQQPSEELEMDLVGLGGDSDSDVSLVDKEYSLLDVDTPTVWAQDQKVPFESVESTDPPVAASEKASGPIDSGISLDGSGSDIALNLGDSGIALDLDGDSGIALDMGGDSGISLDLGSDSGISLAGPADSGIALEGKGSGFQPTVSQMNALSDEDVAASGGTHVEVPMLDEDEYGFAMDGDDTANSVPMLDEDDLAAVQAPRGKGPRQTDGDLAVSIYDVEPSEEYASELADDNDMFAEGSADVFDAADDVFQEGMQTGASAAEFDMPVARKPVKVEAEWGAAVTVGLSFSTVLLALTGWVMFDMVRSMWVANDPTPPTGMMLDTLKSIFG